MMMHHHTKLNWSEVVISFRSFLSIFDLIFLLTSEALQAFCMIINLLGIYRFIPGFMTLTLFQGQLCQKHKLQVVFFQFLSSVL